jgi:hypothetical protein
LARGRDDVTFAGMSRKPPPPGTPARKALAAVEAGPPAEPIGKQLRITAKVRRAIDLMATGKCKQITDAAAEVGMARESLGRALAKPHVIEHMRQRALRTIQMGAARAAEVKSDLLDSDDFPVPIPDSEAAAEIVIQRLIDAGFEIRPADLERGSTAQAMRPSAPEEIPCRLAQLLRR